MADFRAEKLINLQMRFSEFEIPPIHDALLIGKQGPLGPAAAQKMMEAVAPEQYEVIRVDHAAVEALVVRKSLLRFIPQDRLLALILNAATDMMDAQNLLKVRCSVEAVVHQEVQV